MVLQACLLAFWRVSGPAPPIPRSGLASQKAPNWRFSLFGEVTGNIECSVQDSNDSEGVRSRIVRDHIVWEAWHGPETHWPGRQVVAECPACGADARKPHAA